MALLEAAFDPLQLLGAFLQRPVQLFEFLPARLEFLLLLFERSPGLFCGLLARLQLLFQPAELMLSGIGLLFAPVEPSLAVSVCRLLPRQRVLPLTQLRVPRGELLFPRFQRCALVGLFALASFDAAEPLVIEARSKLW